MPIEKDITREALAIVSKGDQIGLRLRIMGGLGIQIICQKYLPESLRRTCKDIDLAARKSDQPKLINFFLDRGYSQEREFNLLNGDRRLIFNDPLNGRQIDVFIHQFSMCHQFPLTERLPEDQPVLFPAELFLGKAQIIQHNEKDLIDLAALLLNYPLGTSDRGEINQEVIGELVRKDWGFYHTIQRSLSVLSDFIRQISLTSDEQARILNQTGRIGAYLESVPKTNAWKARAFIGERVRWYQDVEEVQIDESCE